MTVLTYTAGAKFTARVVKSFSANPALQWQNSYEFRALDPGAEADLLTLGTALVLFEQNIHNTFTVFERLLISTWEPDSKPYDPSVFISTTLTGNGLRDTSGELEPLTTTLRVARVGRSGRFGHMFYRGILAQSDTSAPSGKTQLDDKPAMQTLIETALTTSSFGDYIGTEPAGTLAMVLVNKDGTQVRSVVELIAAGVTQLPTDHAWFNRTTSP
jgi:hypothetical protein